jgi:hypothetical protein
LLLLTVAFAICAGSTTALAHDIGVSEAELIEREDHRYVLSVQAGPSIAHRFLPPLLPEHCGFAGNPRGTQGAGWRSFEFTCEGGLKAADRLDLPWRRDGTMLNARWLDGSEAKALFRNEAGVIAVPLSELRAGSGSWLDAAKRYTALGVEHILAGIDHLLFVLALLFFNVGVELGQLIFVFAVLVVMALLRYGVGITRESAVFLGVERVIVYIIGVLASYWLIERGLGIFPPIA